MDTTLEVFKALADESRLRILGALVREPLSVNELMEVLEMGQSRVSRHLKILALAGILESRRDGARVYYGLYLHPTRLVARILEALEQSGEKNQGDLKNLARVLEERKSESIDHFQKYGAEQDRRQAGLVDANFYRQEILSLLPASPGIAADLGSGSGELALMLRGRVESLICVDQSPNLLERVRRAIPESDTRIGALEHLPLGDGEADTVIASMVFHHLPDPRQAIAEAFRILKPGGLLLVAELASHAREEMRVKFADFWLGFPRERLLEYLTDAGFDAKLSRGGRGRGELECMFLTAVKKSGSERKKKTKVSTRSSGSKAVAS